MVYVDGSSLGNPGPSGYCAFIIWPDGRRQTIADGVPYSTNNRMELRAAIAVLEVLPEDARGELRADARYVVDGVNEWRPRWEANGFRTAKMKEVENPDLWRRLYRLRDARPGIAFVWVKGHGDDEVNKYVDRIARAEAAKQEQHLGGCKTEAEGRVMASMMDDAEFEPAAILAKLEAEAAGGGFEPLPSVLPVESIGPLPKLFQCRPLNEGHVMELAKAIGGGAIMPPLLVLQVGGRAVLLDGHHRLEAMRLAGEGRRVDVEFFRGTVREAVLAACAANSRTKLPMTKTERTDAAWKFVLFGTFSRSHIARAAGVAEGTVATMRRVKGKLGGEAFEIDSWARALLLANNSNPADMTEEDREEWLERTAQRHADTLARTFGGSLTGNPEVAARALAIHFGRRLVPMVQGLGEYLPEEIEGDY